MSKPAALADGDSTATAWRVRPPSEEDSRVRIRAPKPPPADEVDEVGASYAESGDESDSDFIQFLCGRFDLDRERGVALLSTLLEGYVATNVYPIHTLTPRKDPGGEEQLG